MGKSSSSLPTGTKSKKSKKLPVTTSTNRYGYYTLLATGLILFLGFFQGLVGNRKRWLFQFFLNRYLSDKQFCNF